MLLFLLSEVTIFGLAISGCQLTCLNPTKVAKIVDNQKHGLFPTHINSAVKPPCLLAHILVWCTHIGGFTVAHLFTVYYLTASFAKEDRTTSLSVDPPMMNVMHASLLTVLLRIAS